MSLDGKVVAITGGARGIGRATAERLLADGARVAIGDIDPKAVRSTAEELGIACFGELDVTDPKSFDTFLATVERELGPLDVVINNAGIMPVGTLHNEADDITRSMVEVNLLGVVYGSKLAVRRMLPRQEGHVINISSIAGETYVAGAATYCATKHAVSAFTESARVEYRTAGIQFSQVLPTFTNTEMIAGTGGPPAFLNAEPEDIAGAIADLIRRPRPRVRVTRVVGALAVVQKHIPRTFLEPVFRLVGAESMFTTHLNAQDRENYQDRIVSLSRRRSERDDTGR